MGSVVFIITDPSLFQEDFMDNFDEILSNIFKEYLGNALDLDSAREQLKESELRDYQKAKAKADKMGIVPVGGAYWAEIDKTTGKPDDGGMYKLRPGERATWKRVGDKFVPVGEDEQEKDAEETDKKDKLPFSPKDSKEDHTEDELNTLRQIKSDLKNKKFNRELTAAEKYALTMLADEDPVASVNSPDIRGEFVENVANNLKSAVKDGLSTKDRDFVLNNLAKPMKWAMLAIVEDWRGAHTYFEDDYGRVRAEEDIRDLISKFNITIDRTTSRNIRVEGLSSYIEKVTDSLRNMFNSTLFRNFFKSTGIDPLPPMAEGGTLKWKEHFDKLAKPDLGNVVRATDNESLATFFEKHDVLDTLEHQDRQLFTITDNNGDFIPAKGEDNINAHLRNSLENDQFTRKVLRGLREHRKNLERFKDANIDIKSDIENDLDTLETIVAAHGENLKGILDTEFSTPEERAGAIEEAYSALALSLYESNEEFAERIMKGVAETAMYNIELAQGKEVYMPSSHRFPAADKILIEDDEAMAERVTMVSVKYGIRGDTAGFSTDAVQFVRFVSKKEKYRDIVTKNYGAEGNELGIQTEDVLNYDLFGELLEDSGVADAIKDPDILYDISSEFISQYVKLRTEHQASLGDKQKMTIKQSNDFLRKDPRAVQLANDAKSRLNSVVDKKKLAKEWGPNVAEKALAHPALFYSMLAIASSLNTSNGFENVLHSFHDISAGKYKISTFTGKGSVKDWKWEFNLDQKYGIRAGPKIQ